jgi:hypothetical protein
LAQWVDAEIAHKKIQETSQDYYENLVGIADEVHPFSLQSQPKRKEQVIFGLETRAQAFEKIAESEKITDHKQTMNKFRNQINDLAANVEAWWLWVMNVLVALSVDEATQYWLIHVLLPTVYWHQQYHKAPYISRAHAHDHLRVESGEKNQH